MPSPFSGGTIPTGISQGFTPESNEKATKVVLTVICIVVQSDKQLVVALRGASCDERYKALCKRGVDISYLTGYWR